MESVSVHDIEIDDHCFGVIKTEVQEDVIIKEETDIKQEPSEDVESFNDEVQEDVIIKEETDIKQEPLEDVESFNDDASNNENYYKEVVKKGKVFCCYCLKFVMHFPRHLKNNHKAESAVQHMNSLPLQSKERRNTIDEIKRRGTREYANLNPLSFIVQRKSKKGGEDYTPCINCHALFSKQNLHRHFKKCTGLPAAPRNLLSKSKRLLSKNHPLGVL